MSVPEGKRNVETLTVITKGRSFVARTIKVCGNEKHFAKRLRWDFTHNIPDLAVEMFTDCRKANAKQGTTYAVIRRMDRYYYTARRKQYA